MNHFEIEAAVIRAKNGNKEELLKIMEQYKPFIIKTASGFNINGYDMYDKIQIGYVSLINAVGKYRSGSNAFSSYAYNSIKNALRYTARKNFKQSGDISLNAPLEIGVETSSEFVDFLEAEDNVEVEVINKQEVLDLRKAVSKLSSDDQELIVMVYYTGASIKTYAEKKGLGYQQAIRKRDRILEKLRCIGVLGV